MDSRPVSKKRVRIVDDDEMEIEVQPTKRSRRRRQTPSPVQRRSSPRRKAKVVEEPAEEGSEHSESEAEEIAVEESSSEAEEEAADVPLDPEEETHSDEEYFEDDIDPLATIVVNGLVQSLSLSKDDALRAVKEALKRKSILTDEYSRSKPADQLWKVGLDPNVVKRLEPQLLDLRDEMESEKITIPKILNSELPKENKKRALEWYDTLQNMEPFTTDYIAARDDLRAYIANNLPKPLPVTEGQTPEEYKAALTMKEQRLLEEEQEILKLISLTPSYRERILDLNAPREVKARIYEHWQVYTAQGPSSEEGANRKQWLDHALSLPYDEMVKFVLPETPLAMNDLLLRAQKNLNEKVYGLAKVKQELLQVLAQRMTNPLGHHANLALVGPPGVGKSLIYSCVAKAYGIPFERVSLGGLHDPAVLKGHSSTYVGAEPGLIVKILKRIKCSNGMIFFDEIDKLGQTERGREVQYALLHIMDATTNKDFRDTYLSDIPVDLSKMWFVCAMNEDTWLDSALRDRLHILRLKSYKRAEKEIIAREFLVPEALKGVGMAPDSVTFSPEAITELVRDLPEHGNIRPVKDELSLIVGRINLYRSILLENGGTGELKLDFDIPNFQLPLTVTPMLLKKLRTVGDKDKDDFSKLMMYM